MKTIAKAITHNLVQDAWGNKHRENTDRTLIVGETYLVHNYVIKHMLLSQELIEQNSSWGPNRHIELLDNKDEILLDKISNRVTLFLYRDVMYSECETITNLFRLCLRTGLL